MCEATSAIIALENLAGDHDAAVALGKRDDADGERNPAAHVGRRRTAVGDRLPSEPHQFRRAAADIEQDRAFGLGVDQRRAAGRGEQRLGLAVHDFEIDADLLAHLRQEIPAIDGGAAGLGRDQARARDAAVAHLVPADFQRFDPARDGGVAQAARRGDPFAETDDAGEGVDDAEAVMRRARDQKPAIVGAEIERGIGRTIEIRPHSGAVGTRMNGRTATPRVGGTRIVDAVPTRGIEAGRPNLVVHVVSSCRTEGPCPAAGVVPKIGQSLGSACAKRNRGRPDAAAYADAVFQFLCDQSTRLSRPVLVQSLTRHPELRNALSIMNVREKTAPGDSLALAKFGIGQPVRRTEDPVLVQGQGRYTDDINLPGQAYAVIVRSTHAHGVIKSIDTEAARGMPGVLGVYTADDLKAYGAFKCIVPFKNRDGSEMKKPERRPLAEGKVRFVGDPIVCVVAETLLQAKDAAEAISVDIDAAARGHARKRRREARRAAAL